MKIDSIKIHQNSNTNTLLQEATNLLNNYIEQYNTRPLLFLLSGGSALNLLGGIKETPLGKHMTIGVLDERYSFDTAINNFAQITETSFYENAKKRGVRFIDTRPLKNETQEQLARRFENELREWKKSNPKGITIVTQGVGPDGHTSGIMPYPEDKVLFKSLFEGNKWVVGYDAKDKNPYPLRITTTITFLKEQIDVSLAYVTGSNKQKVIQDALFEKEDLATLPSSVLKSMKKVELFTDLDIHND